MSTATPDSSQVHILFDRRIPMRDGVTLSADVYLPARATGPVPVVVMRTPYVKATMAAVERGTAFAKDGYAFVVVDVRGRGDSDGEFDPYFTEGRDGHDTIEWCAAQEWCDGGVGTLGASYPGRIQWLAALEQPPHLRAMVVLVPPSDPFVESPTGVPGPMHLCWMHYTRGHVNQPMDAVDWERVYWHLPLLTMDEQAGSRSPRWRAEIEHARLDEYWRPLRYQNRFGELAVPVLHISGWYDDEQIGTPLNFAGMARGAATAEARAAQRMVMGPWTHQVNSSSRVGEVEFGPAALIDLHAEYRGWFDRWLKGSPEAAAEAPVRIFVMGDNEWRDEREWPLARTVWTRYHLLSGGHANGRFGDGRLTTDPAPAGTSSDAYTYDPARPAPFLTEPTSAQIGGADDYAAVQRRDDVLVYETEPLTEAIEVTGPVRVELYASSSAPDTDFMAMLIDVWPNGFRQRLCDGMVRARFRDGMERPELVEPGTIYRYQIECWNTSQVFKAGHRICLQLTSSAFPKYDRNLNTGAALGVTSECAAAQQRVFHDAEHPSALVLPVIPR